MRTFLSILFLIAFLAIVAGINLYLAKRFAVFFPVWSFRTWIIVFAALSVIMLTGIMGFAVTANPVGSIFSMLSSILIGFFVCLLIATVLTDLAGLAFKIQPSVRGYLSLGMALLLSIYGIWNASTLRVKEITVPIAGLTKEIRAVLLTDIHLGHFRGKHHLEKIVRKTTALNPDVVFNTGDLFDARSRLGSEVLEPFRQINVPHYFVEGNHDKHVGVEEINSLLRDMGIYVLENEVAMFGELQIVGLKHMLADHETFDMHAVEGKTIREVLEELPIDPSRPAILLHHSPDGSKYAEEKKINLQLAGHTHAGQIFPATLLAKLMFKYNSGIYKYNDLSIYVSEGAGTFFAPMRIGTGSEITFIRLIPG